MATPDDRETDRILSRAWILLLSIRNRIDEATVIERENGEEVPGIQDLICALREDEVILNEIIDKIREENESRQPNEDNYIERIVCLEKAVRKLDEKLEKSKKKVQGLTNDLAETRNALIETKNDHERTKSDLKELKDGLQTGQIALNFEKDLATYIYPGGKKIGSNKIFTRMKQWLEEKRDTPQGFQANEKWNQLKHEFSWSDDHEKVFFKLLKLRIPIAHPVVDTKAAESRIPASFTDAEHKCITDLVEMIERVNDLMSV